MVNISLKQIDPLETDIEDLVFLYLFLFFMVGNFWSDMYD